MYDVIYDAEIALCNINKLPLQLNLKQLQIGYAAGGIYLYFKLKLIERKSRLQGNNTLLSSFDK
jgi:hypothetical protein